MEPAQVAKKSWIDFICDDSSKLAITPVGPLFQADHLPVPTMSPAEYRQNFDSNPENKKLLDTKVAVWYAGLTEEDMIADGDLIGLGRPTSCSCPIPGSVRCVKKHVAAKRFELKSNIGTAFWRWGFDNMGEEVSELLNEEEKMKFQCVVDSHAKSTGQSFINTALECLPGHSRKSIVSYYFNVHVLRRMRYQSRLDPPRIDTDDECGEDDAPPTKRYKGFLSR